MSSEPGHLADDSLLTVADFMRLPEEDGFRLELVRGRIAREPAPQPLHGRVQTTLAALLETHARKSQRGVALSNVGFRLETDPATIRVPDLAFVSRERIPEHGYDDTGFWALAPDLAIEIVSPSNTASELQEKSLEYLDAGSRLVWVVYPRTRQVTIYRSTRDIRIVAEGEVLTGEDVMPEFEVPLAVVFRP